MSGIPTLQMSPAKFGKRICIKKPSYFELLALKDPTLVNGGTSHNNLARSYAQLQKAGELEPLSMSRIKRDLSKSMLNGS